MSEKSWQHCTVDWRHKHGALDAFFLFFLIRDFAIGFLTSRDTQLLPNSFMVGPNSLDTLLQSIMAHISQFNFYLLMPCEQDYTLFKC